ncbi:MAG TPA: hypothetical protein VFD88_07755 [Clostridia bacterium]|nr:hypothetical protein [Clostridia bacterium]
MDWTQAIGYFKALLEAIAQLNGVLSPLVHPGQIVETLLADSIGLLAKVWSGFILRTTDFETGGDFTANLTIRHFLPAVQLVADAGLVLAVVWAAYRIMWAGGVRSQYSARLLLPRLFIGTILINFALPLFQVAVQTSNTLCAAIQSFGTLPSRDTWWASYTLGQTAGVWQIVTTGALVVAFDILSVLYLIRYAILIVLAITAPVAGLLFTLPDTHHMAKLWSSLFITNLLMQPAQLFVLAIGFALANGSHTLVHQLFLPASLLIVFKVPGVLGGAGKTATKVEALLAAGLRVIEHLGATIA